MSDEANIGERDARSQAFDFTENNFHTQVRFQRRNQATQPDASPENSILRIHDVARYLNIEEIEIEEVSEPGNEDINNVVPVIPNLSPAVQEVVENFRSSRKRPHDDTNDQIYL